MKTEEEIRHIMLVLSLFVLPIFAWGRIGIAIDLVALVLVTVFSREGIIWDIATLTLVVVMVILATISVRSLAVSLLAGSAGMTWLVATLYSLIITIDFWPTTEELSQES